METHHDDHADAALILRDVRKRYRVGVPGCRAEVEVLRGVDLDAGVGEVVAVVGMEGAGLRTLLLCAAGLLRPDAGSVAWGAGSHRAGSLPPGVALALREPVPMVAEPGARWPPRPLRRGEEAPGILLVGPDAYRSAAELGRALAAHRGHAAVVARRTVDDVRTWADRVLELRDGRCRPLDVSPGDVGRTPR